MLRGKAPGKSHQGKKAGPSFGIRWNNIHLDALEKCVGGNPMPQGPVGYSPYGFAENVNYLQAANSHPLERRQLARNDLLALCQNNDIDDLDKYIRVMAWGGANRENVKLTLRHSGALIDAMDVIRQSSRSDAFDGYREAKSQNRLPGLGISFATKLIYFMGPVDRKGYILDQWTLKSMRLLVHGFPVRVNAAGLPDPGTIGSEYEYFCSCIEDLAAKLKQTPDDTEAMLFSEGRGQGKWREYVKLQHQDCGVRFVHTVCPSPQV